MSEATVSIGTIKRDISELVNRVAYGQERIILTSRGKPKAVLVSVADYERIRSNEQNEARQHWRYWFELTRQFSAELLARRNGQMIDVERIELAAKEELEERGNELFAG